MTVAVKMHASSVQGAGTVQPFGVKDSILFVKHLEIDGVDCYTEGEVRLSTDSCEGFLMIELYRPAPRAAWLAANLTSRSPRRQFGYDNLRKLYTDPAEYMEGTDDDVLILGVHKLEFVEWVPPKYEEPLPHGVFPIPA